MSKNSPEIQKFLDSAKAEAKQAGSSADLVTFEDFWAEKYSANDTDFSRGVFLGDISNLQERNQISYYKELTSYHRGVSALVFPVKKVLRKLMAFLFLPLVSEQNEVNLSVARLFQQLRSYINVDSNAREARSAREIELANKVRDQQEAINGLSEKIEELTAKIAALEGGKKE